MFGSSEWNAQFVREAVQSINNNGEKSMAMKNEHSTVFGEKKTKLGNWLFTDASRADRWEASALDANNIFLTPEKSSISMLGYPLATTAHTHTSSLSFRFYRCILALNLADPLFKQKTKQLLSPDIYIKCFISKRFIGENLNRSDLYVES